MKGTLTPVAAAVGLALASVSAHALNAPALGTAAPPINGLYLAVWDSSGNNSEVVNLGYLASDTTLSSGALTPNSATSPFAPAVNPATGTGNVLQLDFGTIPQFSSLFTSSNVGSTDFMVVDATAGAHPSVQVTSASTPSTAYSALNGIIINIQGETTDWADDTNVANSGVATDTTGTTTWSVQKGPLAGGQLVTNQQFGASVGTALDFYEMDGNTSTHKLATTQYANSTGAGFWFLSTSGDLTWNVPSAVPIPAAVWLFGSGLLGLIGIGRRRVDAAA